MNYENMLRIPEASERYGISVRMFRRLISEKRIPFVKFGQHIYLVPGHIDAFLEANTVWIGGKKP